MSRAFLTAPRDDGGSNARKAVAMAAAFAVCWALLEAGLGALLMGSYDLLQIVWWRYAVHIALLIVLVGPRLATLVAGVQRPVLQVARSATMVVMPAAFALAIGRGASAEQVWSVFWLAPLMAMVLAHAVMGERPHRIAIIGSVAGWLAAAAALGPIALPGKATTVLALIVAASFSAYVVMTRSLKEEAIEANLFFTAVVPLAVLSPLMPYVWVMPSPADAVVMTAIGAVGLVALWALDRACSAVPVWTGANALFIQVLGTVAIISMQAAHAPSAAGLIGVAVLIAVFASAWRGAGAQSNATRMAANEESRLSS